MMIFPSTSTWLVFNNADSSGFSLLAPMAERRPRDDVSTALYLWCVSSRSFSSSKEGNKNVGNSVGAITESQSHSPVSHW